MTKLSAADPSMPRWITFGLVASQLLILAGFVSLVFD
jgi:hypothetical protein